MPILVTCECGKQFQAKDENVGRRFNCPDCGREVVVPKPVIDPYLEPQAFDRPEPKTSGKAIASLVLGILSLFCAFFTGLPAIIFGAIGLSDIGKSKGRLQGGGLAIAGIVIGSVGSLLSVVAVLIALLLPAVQAAREAARRAQCVNNLKQIGLAFHNYYDVYNVLPPSASTDANGRPLLSWRVALLPFMEQQSLYDQFKQDEPWDGPNNIKLIDKMPLAFRCPSNDLPGSTGTPYQVVVGQGSVFEGPKGLPISAITDGTSNTFLVVEAKAPVEWTKPDDVDIAQVVNDIGSKHPGGTNALFVDGSVKFIKRTTPANIIDALATRAGGEVIGGGSF